MSRRSPEPAWTLHDSALWYTCEIAVDLITGRPPGSVPEVLAPFPPRAPDERFWASGEFLLLDHRASGDGSYLHNGGFFFASGGIGLAATGAAAAARAAGNSARRRAAAAAAVPRWSVIDTGHVYVAPSGFTMHTARGLCHWSYQSVLAAQMMGPRSVHFQGESVSGPISWILASDWAELVFIARALSYHPRHPQLLNGGWLPPGWLARCAAHNYATRLTTPQLSSA